MTTITMKGVDHIPAGDLHSYFGNITKKRYRHEVNSSGVTTNPASSLTTAVQSGDVIQLGVISGGATLVDCLALISNASAGSVTGKLGFQYVDGVDSTVVPQDDDFFFAATALSSTATVRKTNVTPPVTLPQGKNAYLILTIGGAAHSADCVVDIWIETIETAD